jgi:phosphoribosylamine---glycine ligase
VRVLLLGGGGREHAIGWKLAAGPDLTALLSAPGNPGLSGLGRTLPDLTITDPVAVAAAALAERVDLVVVGPEAPLAAGVIDTLGDAGIPAFGPQRRAARLESSKAFAKEVMHRAGVPTAAAGVFTDAAAAHAHLDDGPGPYVVKADGLAAGKGVLVTGDAREAHDWVDACFGGRFGDAGRTVVVEEYLEGPEVSVFAVSDGATAVALEPARDHKRLGDGDTGPNTGGMGCYSPVPDLPASLVDDALATVIRPVVAAMAAEGTPFRGFLYAGLVLTPAGPRVLEFNVRLGDPEAQVLLPRLDEDLLPLLAAAAHGSLPDRPLRWKAEAAVDVVLAAAGYPDDPRRGDAIAGLDEAAAVDGVTIFHGGTTGPPDRPSTAGGRVLNVVGTGPDLAAARAGAYTAVSQISFPGMQYRSDIARTAEHGGAT